MSRDPTNFAAQLDAHLADMVKYIEIERTNRPRFNKACAVVRPFSRIYPVRVTAFADRLTFVVSVTDMKAVEPILAELEEALGVSFEGSRDETEWGASRTFRTAPAWLEVQADLIGDGSECRRVKVGEKMVDVYEIQCGPEAAPGDDSLPF